MMQKTGYTSRRQWNFEIALQGWATNTEDLHGSCVVRFTGQGPPNPISQLGSFHRTAYTNELLRDGAP